jgi:hypothetical protein
MKTKEELYVLHAQQAFMSLYNECMQRGELVYDTTRVLRGSEYHFIGVELHGDYWLFEFTNEKLSAVFLKKN